MSTSPPREGSANPGSANGLDEKPRLSEHEKKANHIASGEFTLYSLSQISYAIARFGYGQWADCNLKNKSADKLSARASIDSLNWYLG